MDFLANHATKLLFTVGRDRGRFSPAEVLEAEAAILKLVRPPRRIPWLSVLVGLIIGFTIAIPTVLNFLSDLQSLTGIRRTAPMELSFYGAGNTVVPSVEAAANELRSLPVPHQNDTREVVAFIRRVLWLMSTARTSQLDGVAVEKLRLIGSSNAPLLFGSCNLGTDRLDSVLLDLVTEQEKSALLAALPVNRHLAAIVRRKGWQSHAREILRSETRKALASGAFYLPTEWIDCMADLDDQQMHDLLLAYLEKGNNPNWTYPSVKRTSVNRQELYRRAWPIAARDKQVLDDDLLSWALESGSMDALDVLVSLLPARRDGWKYGTSELHVSDLYVKYVDGLVPEEDAPNWFRTNRDAVSFDKLTRRFCTHSKRKQ